MSESRLHFSVITLFPEAVETWVTTSIVGRAQSRRVFTTHFFQLRDFSTDSYGSVDDKAYGGGGGMVLGIEPLVAAVETAQATYGPGHVIYFSPRGIPLSVGVLEPWAMPSAPNHFILVCGHYEGVDERFLEGWCDSEISLGDFVLTGGELPAAAFIDALARLRAGFFSDRNPAASDSFALRDPDGGRLLEYPQYTRPAEFQGRKVPDVLLSGDHGKIDSWRLEQSRAATKARRPDLIPDARR